MSLTKTPKPERSFAPGPALDDGAALLAWLEAHPGAYLRIPVVVLLPADGLFGPRRAFVGTESAPPENAIPLELDDSTLGIDLGTRLRALCDAGTAACRVWIEGTWGPPMAGLRAAEPPPWPLTVRDVGPLVEGSPSTILVAR